MRKNFILMVALFSAMVGILIAIYTNNDNNTNLNTRGETHIELIEVNNESSVMEIRDAETGVHYLKTNNGLTVMYNADGTIKVTE